MKNLFKSIIAVTVMCLSQPALALSGNELKQHCNDESIYANGICTGYVIGVARGSASWHNEIKNYLSDALPEELIEPHCIPENVSLGQLRDIVKKYLENNPEVLHYDAASLVLLAFHYSFDCP